MGKFVIRIKVSRRGFPLLLSRIAFGCFPVMR